MTGIVGTARTGLTLSWVAKFALHVVLLFLGFVLAYALRRATPLIWWVADPDALRVIGWAGLYALIGAGVEIVFQAERSAWRYASMREVVGLARNVTITTGLFIGLIFFLDRGIQLPRSVLPLAWLVSLALLVGFRMAWRLPHDPGLAGGAPRKLLLEMGVSEKIADLARQMIELSGKTQDVDVMIEFTGLKPGEKLTEALSDEGEKVSPCVEGIMDVGMTDSAKRPRATRIERRVELSRFPSDEASKAVFDLLWPAWRARRSERPPSANHPCRPTTPPRADCAC